MICVTVLIRITIKYYTLDIQKVSTYQTLVAVMQIPENPGVMRSVQN